MNLSWINLPNRRQLGFLFTWLHGPSYGVISSQVSLSAAQVIDLMARLAHGPQVRFVVAFWRVAEMCYGNANFDLASASPGSCPCPTDFFATTAMFQAFAETLAAHTAACGRCSLPNIRSDLFPIRWVVACLPSFPCPGSRFDFRVLASFAANSFPRHECGLSRSFAGF